MTAQRAPVDEQQRRRRAARTTALVVGAIAVAIYAAFILSGVLRA